MVSSERRVVTILFCDLVGFTALTEALDPEDVATIQDAYFAAAASAVRDGGGAVEKFIGDAVVGSFGLPRASGDEPLRAVSTARRIVEAVGRLREALGLAGDLQVRVGVNTGEVLVTFDGVQRTAWRLTGDAVNTAARLQSAAPPDGVLLGPETAYAVESTFALEPAGPLPLKGKTEPLSAWLLRDKPLPSQAGRPSAARLRGGRTPTVGREKELSLLTAAARSGVSTAYLIVAPPGTGKSRLVDELRARLPAPETSVWTAQADLAGGSAYAPVEQLLRQALGLAPRGPVEESLIRKSFAPTADGLRTEAGIAHVLGLLRGEPLDARPDELYRSWTAALHAASGPAVWVIEDLHRGEADLLAFLAAAVNVPAPQGRTIVLTGRPEVLGRPELERLPAETVFLDPLTTTDTADLLGHLAGVDGLPPGVKAAVVAASGGNPLFCEELLHSWARAGVLLADDQGGWRLVEDRAPQLPSSVQAVYQAQLDSLEADPRLVVLAGSVAGRTMPSGVVPSLGVPEPVRPLAELTTAGLLIGPHSGLLDPVSYTFRHALLWDVAYASLPRDERSRLHYSFAMWARRHVPAEVSDDVVARHLLAAYASAPALTRPLGHAPSATPAKPELGVAAAEAAEQAAHRALRAEPQRAAALLAQALDLPTAEASVLLRRRLALAEALRRSGAFAAAMNAFVVAGESAEQVGDATTAAAASERAALGYEEALYASRFPRTTWGAAGAQLLERALAAHHTAAAPRARLLAASARATAYGGDPAAGLAVGHEAVEIARSIGDDSALAAGLLAQRAALADPGYLTTRLAALPDIVAAAQRSGNAETEFEAYRMLLMDSLEAGDLTAADAARIRAIALTSEISQPQYLWYPAMWAAMRALLVGDFGAAEGLISAFAAQGEQWGYHDVAVVALAQWAQLAIDRSDLEAMAALVPRLIAANHPGFVPTVGLCQVLLGRTDEARATLASTVAADFESMPADLSWPWAVSHVAEAVALLGETMGARILVERLRPWQGHSAVLGSAALCLGDLSRPLGLVLHAAGDRAGAQAALRSAIAMNEALGARPAAAKASAELSAITAGSYGRGNV